MISIFLRCLSGYQLTADGVYCRPGHASLYPAGALRIQANLDTSSGTHVRMMRTRLDSIDHDPRVQKSTFGFGKILWQNTREDGLNTTALAHMPPRRTAVDVDGQDKWGRHAVADLNKALLSQTSLCGLFSKLSSHTKQLKLTSSAPDKLPASLLRRVGAIGEHTRTPLSVSC